MDFDKYVNLLEYPGADTKREIHNALMAQVDETSLTLDERKQAVANVNDKVESEYKKLRSQYNDEEDRLRQAFFRDLDEDLGTDVLPDDVRATFHSYAWGSGHSCGYHEVYNVALNVADVVLAAYEAGKQGKQ